jgi:hypothetical protein
MPKVKVKKERMLVVIPNLGVSFQGYAQPQISHFSLIELDYNLLNDNKV